MKSVQFNENMEQLSVSHANINILHAKNGGAQKLGLLNHRILPENEGILFFRKRWFHTFGMRFPICVLAFDKHQTLLAKPTVVEPDTVFVCPPKSNYVVEVNSKHHEISSDFKSRNRVLVLNHFKSKIVYYFIKLLPLMLVLLTCLFTMCSAFSLSAINLNIGKSRTINLEQVPQSIQIDDPDMIDIERIGISNSIKITAKQQGKTSITFQYFDGKDETLNINVASISDTLNDIRQSLNPDQTPPYVLQNGERQLKKILGVHYSIIAGKIFIFGNINTIEKFKEIAKITSVNPSLFFAGFDLNPLIVNKVIDSLNTDIRIMGGQNLKIIQNGDRFLLKGVNTSESNKEKIWAYLIGSLPNVIDATSSFLGEGSLVQINIEFFEVGKGKQKEVGFQYPNLGASGVGVGVTGGDLTKAMFQITPFSVFFRALEERNYVREIAKPVIITRSGEKAIFLAGGEVPIPMVTSSGLVTNVSTIFKSVGILFDVTPRVNDDGTIWIKLNIEYSQVNEKLSYQNVPGFDSRKVNTNIILKEGTAAIISGLIQNKDLKKMEGIPILRSIPILGELFKSKNYSNNSTELWIAISAMHKNIDDMNSNSQKYSLKNTNLFASFHESLL